MLALLARLFRRGPRPAPRPSKAASTARPAPTSGSVGGHVMPAGRDEAQVEGAPSMQAELLAQLDGKGHFQQVLSGREEHVLAAVGRRVEQGDLVLPVLPTTSIAAMDMAARPSAEVADLVKLIAGDPVLSSELLKISNSALYAGNHKCETLREAIMRIGLRALRSMILSISMRAVLLRDKQLAHVAQELWRQAHSVSLVARALAGNLGMDRDRAFLIGLLHDIGKVALLETVRKEAGDLEVRPALLGRIFYLHHERAGERLARAWQLPDEVVAVAGCHHRYERNVEHARAAALASLAHALDLEFSLRGSQAAPTLASLPELEFLVSDPSRRRELVDLALAVHAQQAAAAA